MKSIAKALFAVSALALAAHAAAGITFYEKEDFQGRSLSSMQRSTDMQRTGFDNRASSVVVVAQRWQVCEDVHFAGRCTVLRPGRYPSLAALGLDDRLSSVRPLPANAQVEERDYAPLPAVAQDDRRRRDERLFEADVTSARAVVGAPGQRCCPAEATPSYWDVTYEFRGRQHRVQLAQPPGRTIAVNRAGEPRT